MRIGPRGDHQRVVDLTGGRVGLHDAGVIDEDVEVGMLGDQLRRHTVDARRIGDVELNRFHAGVGRDHHVEVAAPATRDDDLVVELVQGLGEAAADTRPAASDEDGVA
jgi:hypothetical protein